MIFLTWILYDLRKQQSAEKSVGKYAPKCTDDQYSTANTCKLRIFKKLNAYQALSLSTLMRIFKIAE